MSTTKKNILIGEDEKPLAKALKLKLESSGYKAENAYTGDEVIQMIEEKHFDLVLLDLIMPGKDGFGVLEHFKDSKKKDAPKIVILSNLSQEEDTKKALDLGAVDVFIKSNTPISEVVKKIDSLI